MRPGRALLAILTAGSTAWAAEAPAPAAPPSARPSIGLVLAGGGARGGAHVGVLKVMEELRIPVDYVVGTSMGSIVGALYASGYSPEEMEAALTSVDWQAALRDTPERRRISFRRKEDDDLALFPMELGFSKEKGLATKSGVLAGQNVDFLLRSLTLHTLGIDDFDDLNLPYRAVAADLDTGETVVLDHGDLATAMRASMSLPLVFTPVELDGRLLVDGGIADNLPIDVAKDLGAERIIAIDVGTPPAGTDRDLSALGVYSQTYDVLAKVNVREQLETLTPRDLLITPELSRVTTGGFLEIKIAIEAGEAAGRAAAESLKRYAVSPEEYAKFLARQRRRPDADRKPVVVDEIEIRGTTHADPKLLRRRMETKAGAPLDLTVLSKDLERISQAGEFQSVGFRLVPDAGRNRLVVDAKEKTWGPTFVRFGIGLESNLEGDSNFRFIGDVRRTNVNRLGAEWKTIASLGAPLAGFTEFYQPLERSGFWFVAPYAALGKSQETAFLADGSVEEVENRRRWLGFDFGVQFGNYGQIRVGPVRGLIDLDPRTTTTLEPLDRDLGGVRVSARLDQIDNVFFPTEGGAAGLDWYSSRASLGADDVYDKAQVSLLGSTSLGRNIFVGGVRVGMDLGSDIPSYDEFELGGFLNLSGLRPGELRGDVEGLLTLVDYWRLKRLSILGNLYIGAALEAGNAWQGAGEASLADLRYSGLAFFGLDNRLSPIYFGYGRSEGGRQSFYLFIGSPYQRQ